MIKNKNQNMGFAMGLGYAIALLFRDAGDEESAKYVLNESGLSYNDFVEAKVDEYDLVEIKKVYALLK